MKLLLFLMQFSAGLYALSTVQGRVMGAGGSQGLADATVDVPGTSLSAVGNEFGDYSIEVPAETKTLRFRAPGYAPGTRNLKIKPGQVLKLNAWLMPVEFESEEIVVTAAKERPQALSTSLSRKEIKKIPGTGGDALRAIQNLPGVAVVSDFSSQMVVQGGGPNDNLYLLDNFPWPFPFHFGGIISTVNSDLLESVDLHAAGFGTRWGNVMGAVLDGKTRPGSKDRLHASADISMIMSQVMVEGPLGIGDLSFTLAGRRSYFEFLLPYVAAGTFTAFPVFWDLGATLDFSLGPDNRFRLLSVANEDLLSLQVKPDPEIDPELVGDFRLDNSAVTNGLRWTHTGIKGLRSVFTPYYYRVNVETSVGTGANIDSEQNVFGVKEELEWELGTYLNMKHEIGFGGSVDVNHYSVLVYLYKNFFAAPGAAQGPIATTVSGQVMNRSAYVHDRIQMSDDLAVTVGLRYDKSDLVHGDVTLPRLNLEYKPGDKDTYKAAWGLYSQFPFGQQLNRNFGNPGLSANRAEHSVLSYERKFSRGKSARLDGYYKSYRDLVLSVPALNHYANIGEGNAKGIEIFLRQNVSERFFGWISYAYSKSERLNPRVGNWTPYQYDQSNLLTVVASYDITPAWNFGSKLHYNTGPLQQSFKGRYQDFNGRWWGIFSETYDQRLDDYLRWDLRTDYTWRNQGWQISAYIEVLNVLGRPNPQGLNYKRDFSGEPEVINNLPRFPYFGISAEF